MTMTIAEFARARHGVWLHKTYGINPNGLNQSHANELTGFHYTNLWRELDRHTVYLFNEIQQTSASPAELVTDSILFRLFNKIDTWEAFKAESGGDVYEWASDKDRFLTFLQGRKGNFTNAYMRCSSTELIAEFVQFELGDVADSIAAGLTAGDVAKARQVASEIYSFGGFLADQIIMDLDWLGGPLTQGKFSPNWGPGAKNGLAAAKELTGLDEADLLASIDEAIPAAWRPRAFGLPVPVDVRLFEHTLCEYFKYVRQDGRAPGEGKSRKYQPTIELTNPPRLPYSWTEPVILSS